MSGESTSVACPAAPPAGAVDMQAVLTAWQTATERLQQTHETLSAEVRRLTDELARKNRELARKNRLADLGQMASHIAHEVRNNLVPMTLYLSLLRRRLEGDPEALRVMDKIDAGFTALQAIVQDLLHFTADRQPEWQTFKLRRLVQEVCETLGPQLQAQRVRVEMNIDGSQLICADRDMLHRALVNLVLNALDAMPDGGELTFTCCASTAGIELEVADSGNGIPEEFKARLFEPFFTTKSRGTGLGLAIVDRIAQAHGGEVSCISCPEGGTAFTLRIPNRTLEAAA